MYLDIHKHPEAKHYRLYNKDTGKEISHVVWADDEKGEYGQYKLDENGKPMITKLFGDYDLEIIRIKGNIELRKDD